MSKEELLTHVKNLLQKAIAEHLQSKIYLAYSMRILAASQGGQMPTCAIRRSGTMGLDLVLATGPDLDLSELGRRLVGQRRVCPGGWLRGR
jgi:hypothetical protein